MGRAPYKSAKRGVGGVHPPTNPFLTRHPLSASTEPIFNMDYANW